MATRPQLSQATHTLAQHVAYMHDWARRDREFSTRQAKRDEKQWPGLCAALAVKLREDEEFSKPGNHTDEEDAWSN